MMSYQKAMKIDERTLKKLERENAEPYICATNMEACAGRVPGGEGRTPVTTARPGGR